MCGMKRRKKIIYPLVAVAAGVLTFLLLPFASKEHAIRFKQEAIEAKREFLLRQSESERKTTGAVDRRPNIIIITADDLGKTDMSLYGGTTVETPNMDAIGHEGVIFTDAYCTSPICAPSRASMLTGRYQQRYGFEVQPQNRYPKNRLEYLVYKHFIDTGSWFVVEPVEVPKQEDVEKQGLPPSEITLGELLQSSGYATGIIGKWHLGHYEPFIPSNRGFDYQYGFYEAFSLYAPTDSPDIVNYRHDYFANKHIWSQERKGPCAVRRNHEIIREDEYLTHRIAEEAIAFMQEHRAEPFFLYVPFSAPHTPFQAPKEYYELFSHVEDENKRVYYAMIKALDDGVGRIMEALKEYGLDQNTIVMFASDNGGATYTGATDNAPLQGGKFSNFEGGINVPCMIRMPDVLRPGQRYHHQVSLLDFFTTAAALAGAGLPQDRVYDGVNLMPYLEKLPGDEDRYGKTAETGSSGSGPRESGGVASGKPREALFWRAAYNKAVIKDEWKLVVDEKADRILLFNLDHDKEEKHNRAADYPKKVEELLDDVSEWEKGLIEPLWPRVMDFRFIIDGEVYDFAL